MTVVMYRSQRHDRQGQRIDTSQIQETSRGYEAQLFSWVGNFIAHHFGKEK